MGFGHREYAGAVQQGGCMARSQPLWMLLATLAVFPAQSAETQDKKPLTKPGQTYVGIDVTGCADKCPSYEIYLFENGRMMFRPNNTFTSRQGLVNRSPFGTQYGQLVAAISSGNFFKEKPACKEAAGHTAVTLFSTVDGAEKKTSYSFGCPDEAVAATSLISQFVDRSGTWKLINSSWKYWTEKKFDSK
jgi:hypothetical protein